jgi:hypothetical protein
MSPLPRASSAITAKTFVGIDFAGGSRPWRTSVSRPPVWIAIVSGADEPRLERIAPVQALDGDGTPFERLVRLLATDNFEAAAIDAPFSLPNAHMPQGGQTELLRNVRAIPNAPDRPFPSGADILNLGPGDQSQSNGETSERN